MSVELTKAPPWSFDAVGTAKRVNLAELGTTALLICLTQQTMDQVGAVVSRVRERFPDNAQLMLVRVVDLRSVTAEERPLAESTLQAGYEKRVARLEPGLNPVDHVTIIADWAGAVGDALGLADPEHSLGVAVLDRRGYVVGAYEGDEVATTAIGWIGRADLA